MALVANYDSSEEEHSSGEEDESPAPQTVVTKVAPAKQESTMSTLPSSSSASKGHINFFEDDDEEELKEEEGSGALGNLLPKPREGSQSGVEFEEVGPIPPKKNYGDEEELKPPPPPTVSTTFHNIKSTRTQGSKIQITAPSLKDFEDEEEDKGRSKRYVQPSKKGSGLFSILPEPKGSFSTLHETVSFLKTKPAAAITTPVPGTSSTATTYQPPPTSVTGKSNSLVPDSVRFASKRPPQTKLDEIKAKYLKKEANVQIVRRSKNPLPKPSKDSDDSEEEAADFFSLDSASKDELDEETFEKLKLPPPVFQEKLPEPVWNTQQDTPENSNEATASSSTSQEDIMKYVPKRKKGKPEEDLNFIEVKADDLKADSTEWVKNITDDSAVPTRKFKGPGGMQKKKHQITYLAFEAKAREQELQAQWAQNRATKRQTQMKYGF